MDNKMGKSTGGKARLGRSATISIASLSHRDLRKMKRMSDNEDEVDDTMPKLDEIGIISPDTSTQSTESLPSPSSAVPLTIELDPQEQNMISDEEEDDDEMASTSRHAESMDQDPSPGLIKVPANVIRMIKNARTATTMYSEILLDGCVPPLRLIDTKPEYNGIRYKWYITADHVAKKIFGKNNPTPDDNNNNNSDNNDDSGMTS